MDGIRFAAGNLPPQRNVLRRRFDYPWCACPRFEEPPQRNVLRRRFDTIQINILNISILKSLLRVPYKTYPVFLDKITKTYYINF